MICIINVNNLRKFKQKEQVIGVEQLKEQRLLVQKLWEASGLIHKYHQRQVNPNYYIIGGKKKR